MTSFLTSSLQVNGKMTTWDTNAYGTSKMLKELFPTKLNSLEVDLEIF